MTKRLGIIGYPIGHSISPIFQQAALNHLGIDAIYEKWEIEPGDVVAYRCLECMDRWDVVMEEEGIDYE